MLISVYLVHQDNFVRVLETQHHQMIALLELTVLTDKIRQQLPKVMHLLDHLIKWFVLLDSTSRMQVKASVTSVLLAVIA